MIGPAELCAAVVLGALVLYTLSGGADFGGGVWDLLARGPRADRQRERIARAIGPIWEANHVWLILVIVMLFVCFPSAFAAVSTALHVPLTVFLIGIVLRGSAFVFRAYDDRGDATQRRWGWIFAVSSVVSPVMLGVCLGAVSSGAIRVEGHRVLTDFVSAWWAPFPFAIGLFTLSLFAMLAAVYLCVDVADEPDLQADFRIRAIASALITAALAYVSLALSRDGAPLVWDALTGRPWSLMFHATTGLLGATLIGALLTRQYLNARGVAILLVVAVEVGWTLGQWPYVVPPDLTLHGTAAPPSVLWPVLGALAVGALVLVPSFLYLYAVFKTPPRSAS